MAREWVLTINAPDSWLTANLPKSWRARSALASAWRRATYQTARAAKLPTGLTRVRIEPTARFIAGRAPVRDIPNLAPTIKAAIDGLGPADWGKTAGGTPWIAPGYGLVPDDDDRHVELGQTVVGQPLPRRAYGPLGQLILTITEVSDVD